MSVTSHMKAFMIETMRTRESRIIFVDNLFLKESQCLRRLEGGARRISSHDGTVQQRLRLSICSRRWFFPRWRPIIR